MNGVISHEEFINSVLPVIVELCEDASWRVRLAIVEYMPMFANEFVSVFSCLYLKLKKSFRDKNFSMSDF